MKTKLFSAVCAASMLANPVFADDEKMKVDLSSWDTDNDKMVSQEEWAEHIDSNDLFNRIDENNNGTFDIEESVETGIDYDVSMDIDDGGTISRDEFIVGLHAHYDDNDDNLLDDEEFNAFATNDESSFLMTADTDVDVDVDLEEDGLEVDVDSNGDADTEAREN